MSKKAEKLNKHGTSSNASNGVNESATINAIARAISADKVAKHVVTRVRAPWTWMVKASCLSYELASCHDCE